MKSSASYFECALVRGVDVAGLVEVEADQVSFSALFLGRHPGDVIVSAVILEHDDLADVQQRAVDVAIHVQRQALGRVGEFGQSPQPLNCADAGGHATGKYRRSEITARIFMRGR